MTREQRTALERLRARVARIPNGLELGAGFIVSGLDAILAQPEPDHTALIEKLEIVANDAIIHDDDADAVREAITALRGEGE